MSMEKNILFLEMLAGALSNPQFGYPCIPQIYEWVPVVLAIKSSYLLQISSFRAFKIHTHQVNQWSLVARAAPQGAAAQPLYYITVTAKRLLAISADTQ